MSDDMTASAASQIEAMSSRAATNAAQQSVRTSVALTKAGVRVSAHVAHQTVGGTIRALITIIDAARLVGANKRDTGQIGLKQFTRLSTGKREILPVDEREIARQFARELRRHGVTFAIERHKDGSRTFHVEGKDVAVVEHALAQASSRVDEQIRRASDVQHGAEQADKDQQPEQAEEPETAVVELDEQQTEQVAEVLADDHRDLAELVRQEHRIVITPVNLGALDAAALMVPAFEALPVAIQDWLIAARAAEPSDLSLAGTRPADLPDIDEDALVTVALDRQEQAALLGALHRSTEPTVLTLSGDQATALSSAIRRRADGLASEHGGIDGDAAKPAAGHRYDELNELAGQVEQSGTLPLDQRSADAIRDVFDSQVAPETLTEVEAMSRTFAGTVEREVLAEQIEREGQVCLDPETVGTLHTMFGEPVWIHGDNEHMSWVVGMVNRQHDHLATVVPPPTVDRLPDNPPHSIEREPNHAMSSRAADSTPDWDGHAQHDKAVEQVGELIAKSERAEFDAERLDAADLPEQANQLRSNAVDWQQQAQAVADKHGLGSLHDDQEPNAKGRTATRPPEQSAGQEASLGTDRAQHSADQRQVDRTAEHHQLSPRDATRERVAKQINTRATAIKQERGVGLTKTHATPRNPKMTR